MCTIMREAKAHSQAAKLTPTCIMLELRRSITALDAVNF